MSHPFFSFGRADGGAPVASAIEVIPGSAPSARARKFRALARSSAKKGRGYFFSLLLNENASKAEPAEP
jgi:hypothetical protein